MMMMIIEWSLGGCGEENLLSLRAGLQAGGSPFAVIMFFSLLDVDDGDEIDQDKGESRVLIIIIEVQSSRDLKSEREREAPKNRPEEIKSSPRKGIFTYNHTSCR